MKNKAAKAKPKAKTLKKPVAASKAKPVSVKLKAKKPAPAKKALAKPVMKSAAKPKVAPVKTVAAKPVLAKPAPAKSAAPARVTASAGPMMRSPGMATMPAMRAPAQAPGKPQARAIVTVAPPAAENDNIDFTKGDMVVYPAHGVGKVEGIETQTIAGISIQLYAIAFEKDRMKLKIPVVKAKSSGLRKLCSTRRLKDAIDTLQGRARVRRTMWSRRAQEYEMKINSGDPIAIAEVLRDLKRSNDDSEQSYSERQIYQSALERLAREYAAIKNIPETKATERLEGIMGTKKTEAA